MGTAERVPQPHLVGGATLEPASHVLAVVPFWGGREPEEHARADVSQEPFVGRCLGVVKLVDDDDVEVVGRELRREVHAPD